METSIRNRGMLRIDSEGRTPLMKPMRVGPYIVVWALCAVQNDAAHQVDVREF